MVFDAGDVIAGAEVVHEYNLHNPTDEVIRLDRNGIRTHCSCSEVVPPVSVLRPGESTTIPLTVRTASLGGGFEKGVDVPWVTDQGSRYEHRIRIRGLAKPGLVPHPSDLAYSMAELEAGKEKIVRLSSGFPCDWANARCWSENPNFSVRASKPADGTFHISYRARHLDESHDTGVIRFSVPMVVGGKELVATAEMGVVAQSVAKPRVLPPEPRWVLDEDTGQASVRFLLVVDPSENLETSSIAVVSQSGAVETRIRPASDHQWIIECLSAASDPERCPKCLRVSLAEFATLEVRLRR